MASRRAMATLHAISYPSATRSGWMPMSSSFSACAQRRGDFNLRHSRRAGGGGGGAGKHAAMTCPANELPERMAGHAALKRVNGPRRLCINIQQSVTMKHLL